MPGQEEMARYRVRSPRKSTEGGGRAEDCIDIIRKPKKVLAEWESMAGEMEERIKQGK